jgi:hypothetical protein
MFVNKILQTNAHFICTIRSKTDYVMSEKNGKQVPEKVGLKGVQRDNIEYEFTVLLEMDIRHKAKSSKDRTGIFSGMGEFTPTEETGRLIAEWCNNGIDPQTDIADAIAKLKMCDTVNDLQLLKAGLSQHVILSKEFIAAGQIRYNEINVK